MKYICLSLHFLLLSFHLDAQSYLKKKAEIGGAISPKSIVHSGNGLFFAQNMIYQHSVTVYDRNYVLQKTISDKIKLSNFGVPGKSGWYSGGPVEAAATPDGKYVWVSNYRMTGEGYYRASMDTCSVGASCEKSFLYKISCDSLTIEAVAEAGCVPKFLAVSPDGRLLLISNWCSGTLSILDAGSGSFMKEIWIGAYPRGIAITSDSRMAYVTTMGNHRVSVVNLNNYSVSPLPYFGKAPRHLCISPDDRSLYISLNGEGEVICYNIPDSSITGRLATGENPRSMVLSKNGQRLYVANYKSNSISKIRTDSFSVMEVVKAPYSPIGITFDDITREVWIAGYSGQIWVYKDWEPVQEFSLWDWWQKRSYTAPKTSAVSTTNSKVTDHYYVVVASYSTLSAAQIVLNKLQQKGYDVLLIPVTIGDRYRIGLGAFDRAMAVKKLGQIRKQLEPEAWLLKELE